MTNPSRKASAKKREYHQSMLDHIFISSDAIRDEYYRIEGEDFHHLARVKRARIGERVSLSDGRGQKGVGTIERINKYYILLKIDDLWETTRELPLLHLFQSIPKAHKMDEIVRKNVELGVDIITPFVSSRSLLNRGSEKLRLKVDRWRKIAMEASRQCVRDFLPAISEVAEWGDCLADIEDYPLTLVAWEEEKGRGLSQALPKSPPSKVAYFVGPEGGFSEDEVGLLTSRGTIPVSLGNNIIRTENAGLVMTVVIKSFYGYI